MSGPIVVVADYGLGNLFNIGRALSYLGAAPRITTDPDDLRGADKIVLPGVGAFGVGIANLRASGMAEAIVEQAAEGKDILGICLGMQLVMTESSEDGRHRGLDLIPGRVERLEVAATGSHKVPQIGWNTLSPREPGGGDVWADTILRGLGDGTYMYFVHSYRARTASRGDTLALTTYGGDVFSSVVKKDNVAGCQFHPERSAESGIKVLRNFLEG